MSYTDTLERLRALKSETPLHSTVRTDRTPEIIPSVSYVSPIPEYSGMTAKDRRAWSDELCRRLHAGMVRQNPPGLARWSGVGEIVAGPSDRLLSLLADWEASGNDADRRAAIVAAEDVALAWEQAAKAWMDACTPGRGA